MTGKGGIQLRRSRRSRSTFDNRRAALSKPMRSCHLSSLFRCSCAVKFHALSRVLGELGFKVWILRPSSHPHCCGCGMWLKSTPEAPSQALDGALQITKAVLMASPYRSSMCSHYLSRHVPPYWTRVTRETGLRPEHFHAVKAVQGSSAKSQALQSGLLASKFCRVCRYDSEMLRSFDVYLAGSHSQPIYLYSYEVVAHSEQNSSLFQQPNRCGGKLVLYS